MLIPGLTDYGILHFWRPCQDSSCRRKVTRRNCKKKSLQWVLEPSTSQLLAVLSSVVRGGQVHTQPSPSFPPPKKFSLGDDFRRWAAYAQEYVELFTPSDRRRVLFSLLEGEAKDIARGLIRPGYQISANTFSRLRQNLTDDTDRLTARYKFQTTIQQPGENIHSFVRYLRRWAEDAFPELDEESRDCKILDQVCICVRHPELVKRFRRQPPLTLQDALETGHEIEQLENVLREHQLGLPENFALIHTPNTSGRFADTRGFQGPHSRR
ncbi:unnamed protein product [Echinostoma caproni]|uniref:Paraneoplastic antigen Ma-like C-terminal domain-containing protein n=1 Tax=Echinostoma caproni TaxID=27848 RepID=A0A3P8IIT8_9TREM|nr:unnamed protein product [Echinostoma caproni]